MERERQSADWRGNVGSLVANFVNFCRHTAQKPRERDSVSRMLTVNLKSLDRRAAWAELHGAEAYIDWAYVDAMTTNSMGDFGTCILMVSFLEFPEAEAHYKTAPPVAYLAQFRADVAASGLALALPQVLRMVLLANTMGLVGYNVLEQYTSRVLDRPTRAQISELTARMSDYRYTATEYTASLAWVLREAVVAEAFWHEVDMHFAQRESLEQAMRVKHLEVSHGRPRLVDRLAKAGNGPHSVAGKRGGSQVVGEGFDSLDNWVARVRFPNTVSQRLKRRLYVIVAQPHVDHARVVGAVTSSHIAPGVLREKISRPDERIIINVLENLNIQREPFAELTLFVRSCFRAFPQKDLRAMTLLTYMQLYMASYQHRELWKACWVAIHPLLSYQVIKDVEEFVAKTPFNEQAFIDIMLTE